jgi:hypothetical protein
MKIALGIILFLFIAIPVFKIVKKTGHHPLLAIFFLLPFVNLVVLYILASGKWPIEYERDALLIENQKMKENQINSNKMNAR